MNKKSVSALILLIIIFQAAFGAWADSGDGAAAMEPTAVELIEQSYKGSDPIWLMMERGRQAFELGEYGLASRVFREIINREGVSPDAHMWLGFIFDREGEYILAEKQYLKALENRNQLYVLEDEYTIMYKLSDIYKLTDQWGKYEKILLEVVEKDDSYRDSFSEQYAMVDLLKERGADKLFELYRHGEGRYNRARTELGVFYYRTGRYNDAENNLILPLMSIATAGFDYIYKTTADYEFTDLESHFKEMYGYPQLSEYTAESELNMTLYYLAAALHADGFEERARELWMLLWETAAKRDRWRERAGRQLQSPFIEPVIIPRS